MTGTVGLPATTVPAVTGPAPGVVDLEIGGMSCASCVSRVERALESVAGVTEVSVNLATDRARVRTAGGVAATSLVAAVREAGYEASVRAGERGLPADGGEARHRADLRRRLARITAGAVLSAATLILAYGFGGASWSNAAQLVVTLPVFLWVGGPFHRSALRSLRHATVTMDTLVSLGATAAYTYSIVATVALPGRATYFDTASLIVTLISVGSFCEVVARHRAGSAIAALAGLQPRVAHRLEAAGTGGAPAVDVDVELVAMGDRLLVKPGERIPTDGIVVRGSGTVDESLMTGESLPVARGAGDRLIGGTVNGRSPLEMRVDRTGSETVLAHIVQLVERAQAEKAPAQRLADRVSSVFVPTVIALAAVTFAAWLLTGHGVAASMIPAVATLVVACPCALGLATPVAIMVSSGRGAELGLLIRGGETLETVHRLRVVVLDKTGTLTLGRPEVLDVVAVGTGRVEPALALAAAVESGSEHSLGQAVLDAASRRGCDVPDAAQGIVSHPGGGIEGTAGGHRVLVGSPRWLAEQGVPAAGVPPAVEVGRGGTRIGVAVDGALRLRMNVADPLRPESAAGVRRLRSMGLRVVLATGDTPEAAAAISAQAGIGEWHAGLSPEGKAALVTALRRGGAAVAMVGDGVNDAPALAAADVGIALGGGTGVAMAAAAITLVRGDVGRVGDAIALGRATLRTIHQNLGWAFGYNLVLVPLAMLGIVPPVLAALAMALSSVTVVGNALRLRRFARGRGAAGLDLPQPTKWKATNLPRT
ncbi:MAG: cation-translocating P-type ATPase [Candidatus Dormibacteria bacterium]